MSHSQVHHPICVVFIKQVPSIPISRLSVITPDYDFMADDILVNLCELIPNQISFQSLAQAHDKELERGESASH